MKKNITNSSFKSILTISAIALSVLAMSQAQADEHKTVYTGLGCQPHDPQYATVDTTTNTLIPTYSYFGSEIINEQADPATGGFFDLGMNCNVDRTLFGRSAKLKSVNIVLTDTSDPAIPDDGGYCHTHIEYASAGTINTIIADDVYAADAGAGVYQTVTLPQTVVAPTNDANYNIHCHIYGQGSVVNGYTVVEKN
jgi:hypothetical protein